MVSFASFEALRSGARGGVCGRIVAPALMAFAAVAGAAMPAPALAQEAAPQAAAQPLQPLIDATPEGGVLAPPPGVYSGPARIEKPMTLDGGGKLVLDSAVGRGTTATIWLPPERIIRPASRVGP